MVRRYYNKRSWLDQLQVWIGGIALRHVDHSGIGEASKTNRTSEALKTHPCVWVQTNTFTNAIAYRLTP